MLMRTMFHDFTKMKRSMLVSTALFAIGIYLGAEWDLFRVFLQGQLESLRDLAGQLNSMENAHFWTGVFIFFNNTIKAIAVMYLGLLLGFIPMFFLIVNGMVIGFLLMTVYEQGQPLIPLIINGLLPHGILEIPAILLACAYGLRLGAAMLAVLAAREGAIARLKQILKVTLPVMVFLTIVLLTAAVIESTLTVWLLSR